MPMQWTGMQMQGQQGAGQQYNGQGGQGGMMGYPMQQGQSSWRATTPGPSAIIHTQKTQNVNIARSWNWFGF